MVSTLVARAARGWRPAPGVWVAVPVVAAWAAVHLVTGTPAGDLLAWSGAVLAGVLIPGAACVRAVRRDRAPLVEDLAWAAPAGCLVALAGWLVDRLAPWSPGPFLWGAAVVAVLLAGRTTRARVLARPAPGWSPGAMLATGLVLLVSLVWMTTTSLQWLPVNPGPTGVLYSQDTLFQAGLVGELRRHLIPDYPFVAGEPLHYHWFLYAILAFLTTGSGIDPLDASLRLGPTTVLPAVLLIAGVVARRLSGRVAAGPVAMALLAAVDLSLANRWGWSGSSSIGGTYSPVIGFWRGSPPQALGWLAGIAALGTAVAWLRRSEPDRAVPTALLLPFLLLCAGSKSSVLPVLAAGVGLALLAAVFQRRGDEAARAALLLLAAAVIFALGSVVIYRGGSYGTILAPGARLALQAEQLFPGLPGPPLVAVVAAFAVATLPLLPRLAGLLWLVVERSRDPGTWVVVGTGIGGFAATYLLRHPAQSELYFLVSAYPLAVVGSAAGVTALLERGFLPAGRRLPGALTLAGSLVLGAAAAALVAAAQPRAPLAGWARRHPGDPTGATAPPGTQAAWYLLPLAELSGAVAVLVVVLVLLVRRVRPREDGEGTPGRIRVLVAPVAVAVLLGTGVYGASQSVLGTDSGTLAQRGAYFVAHAGRDGVLPTTQDLVDGGRWLQAHAGADDVVATNRWCVQTRRWSAGRARCDAREFSTSALSQRRSYVGGWAYADRILAQAWSRPPPYRKISFWDQARLARQRQAFARPTTAGLDALRAAGVRWLWADLRDGPVAVGPLDRLADLRWSGPHLRIWQLRAPTTA